MVATVVTPSRRLADAARNAPPVSVEAAARLLGVVAEHRDRAPFVSRVLNALARLTDVRDEQPFEDASSDFATLLRMLSRPEALDELRAKDALAPARLHGLKVRERILSAEGGACSGAEMAATLGISRQAIDKRRRRGTLIGMSLGRRGYAYPSWQIGLDGLETVLAELRGYDAWTLAAFMLTPNPWLDGESPLAGLRRGDQDRVADAARMYGEHVAA